MELILSTIFIALTFPAKRVIRREQPQSSPYYMITVPPTQPTGVQESEGDLDRYHVFVSWVV